MMKHKQTASGESSAYEVGRWRQKARRQEEELRRLKAELERAWVGLRQAQAGVDGILTAVVLEYGEDALDPDTGEAIGKNLRLPALNLDRLRADYEIHARRDEERDGYILGVMERDNEAR